MITIISAFILIYIFIICGIFMITLLSGYDFKYKFPTTPKMLYNNTDLNYASCFFIVIFLYIVNPIAYFVQFIIWLCHVGRKI
jgi:hypothetical protein